MAIAINNLAQTPPITDFFEVPFQGGKRNSSDFYQTFLKIKRPSYFPTEITGINFG